MQSISSTRGSDLLHAFLDKVHAFHSSPPVFPRLERQLVSACTYRVAASAAPTRAASPVEGRPEPTGRFSLVERRFGDLGKDRATAEIYERIVRSDESKIGEVWLDGKSVGLTVVV